MPSGNQINVDPDLSHHMASLGHSNAGAIVISGKQFYKQLSSVGANVISGKQFYKQFIHKGN